ncbi:hypothetical protein D3C81_2175000 [compost metagenome]
MQQIQIDVIGAQPAQAALASLGNALAAGVVRVHLADHEDVVALAGDGIADHFLGTAFGVHFGGVDQGHAQFDAQAQCRDFLRVS